VTPSGAGAVRVTDLHASYRRLLRRDHVLNGVSFIAKPGQITAIVGRNGEGKTTLFRTILGFQRPDSGAASIGDMAPTLYRRAYGIGFVPDGQRFPSAWTAADILARGVDLARGADVPGVPHVLGAEDPSEVFDTAVARAAFDAATLAKAASRLSKGNQQRLRLAYAMIGEPKVVLLDEPSAGLDPPSRVALRAQIEGAAEGGAAVLLASHDLSEVERLAHQVLILRRGVVTLVDTLSAEAIESRLMEESPE
jgi:ABC-type multidrug transport system ATPase subunit